MAKLHLLVQLTPGTRLKWHVCEDPRWFAPDLSNRSCIYLLIPPAPIDEAYQLHRMVQRLDPILSRIWARLPWPSLIMYIVRHCCKLKYPGYPRRLPASVHEQWHLEQSEQVQLLRDLTELIQGRLLPDTVLEQALRTKGWWPADIRRALDWGLNIGQFECFPGVQKSAWGESICTRCGTHAAETRPCPFCSRSDCPVCTACEAIGVVRGCTRLWVVAVDRSTLELTEQAKPEVRHQALPRLYLEYDLTPAQELASQRLVEFIHSRQQKILVWAACGAGKTEVTFAAIQTALGRGWKVLFAIPRRDVVRELADRIQAAFPDTEIAVHYGGQPWQQDGQLVIATTHQALRFYRCFNLVILDEIDAFPYHGSEMLRFAIKRSLTPEGKMIEMTATPRKIGPGEVVTIPARHHGWPLPQPQFLKLKLPELSQLADKGLPEEVVAIIKNNPAPWLIFAPTIPLVKQITKHLTEVLGRSVCGSWAADPERDQKKEGFASGRYQVMVATSIMERGITIANVQVMVLYCDHVLFDANSLIQMAGRVGRKAEHPVGEVWFIGARLTDALKTAQKRIRYLNQQAAALGLLKESGIDGR